MMIDFAQKILDLRGKPILSDGKSGEEATLADICANALLAPYPDETGINGKDKVKRFLLAQKIVEATSPLELTADQVDLVKRLVAKGYGPVIVGRAWLMLDPAEKGE